jgi:catalase
VGDDKNSLIADQREPVVMQVVHLLEKLGPFDRERIPKHEGHVIGASVGGYF